MAHHAANAGRLATWPARPTLTACHRHLRWPLLFCLVGLFGLLLPGCASLPPHRPATHSQALPASSATPLGAMAAQARQGQDATASGVLAMPQAGLALDMRLALIRQASRSLDLQTYELGQDPLGRLVLRELRDAARRGVRVRLLLDDFHTTGLDPLLRALADEPNLSVRLFNPFAASRGVAAGRWLQLAADFDRLNRRMHNKLFIADSAWAVMGGRNLAAGYFLRDRSANFMDVDVLLTGAVLPPLTDIFDRYWNNPLVHDIQALAAEADDDATRTLRREAFEQATAGSDTEVDAARPALSEDPAWAAAIAAMHAARAPALLWAQASAFADVPDKRLGGGAAFDLSTTVTGQTLAAFHQARSELMLFSPYFVPGTSGMAGLAEARRHGIAVRVITNSLSASDEPLVSMAYERYRLPMLRLGVELYEVSSSQIHRDVELRRAFGESRAQLHAKVAIIDRSTVLLGSMNLDQRSATTNTELGLAVRSPALAGQLLAWFRSERPEDVRGGHQVMLRPDGQGLQWRALRGDGRGQVLQDAPDADPWQRLRLWLMSLLVPESVL